MKGAYPERLSKESGVKGVREMYQIIDFVLIYAPCKACGINKAKLAWSGDYSPVWL